MPDGKLKRMIITDSLLIYDPIFLEALYKRILYCDVYCDYYYDNYFDCLF